MSNQSEASAEMAKNLACWSIVLDATHKVAEAVRQMETIKEGLQDLHVRCEQITELDSISFQLGKEKLKECKTKIDELSRTGVPLKEQHQFVEKCLTRMIKSGKITEADVSEIQTQLDNSIAISKQHLEEMKKFLVSMEKLREFFSSTIAEVEKESSESDKKATNWKRWGYGLATALSGVAAILGLSCSFIAAAAGGATALGVTAFGRLT
ncbi:hypothetical protein BOX15_Mlig021359g3 [Macrostomum lignano]|uniref:Uncharacterized protein n=1 Tax=Macrostomum lignano TaxID=282301 RepID=A0A267G4P6_9PLAT|nr:hypothetical protein BOX15_Mlig021359g3 [Macrostomum lignano]